MGVAVAVVAAVAVAVVAVGGSGGPLVELVDFWRRRVCESGVKHESELIRVETVPDFYEEFDQRFLLRSDLPNLTAQNLSAKRNLAKLVI